MLGHKLWQVLANEFDTYVTLRRDFESYTQYKLFDRKRAVDYVSVKDFDSVVRAFEKAQPKVVVNCIGLVKQVEAAKDPLLNISVNALFPNRLAKICQAESSRLIHISTDCVFDGKKGNYIEKDFSNANDLYGKTKHLGEVVYSTHCVTLRTSLIGHELKGKRSLVEWFLDREGSVRGFTRAIYTGFPTVEMARIICDFVIPQKNLNGIYHVSSEPISKYDLLRLIAARYGKKIDIKPYEDFVCDRSLDSSLFRKITGYRPPSWPKLVDKMYKNYSESKIYSINDKKLNL